MTSAHHDRLDLLQRALMLYAEHAESSPEQIESLLRENPEVRELLEPMFLPTSAAGAAALEDVAVLEDAAVVGTVVGDYEILREIGRGGMATVYVATERSLRRQVALKLLPPERTNDPQGIVRFRREAAAAAGLDHPGIVKVHASGEADGTHYIAMDLINGVPLSRVLERLRETSVTTPSIEDLRGSLEAELPTPEVSPPTPSPRWQQTYIAAMVGLVADVADALAHAHAHGVIHRDVKPANIMVRADGTVVLTDFGIARHLDERSITATGDVAGTPYYIAPEQVQQGRIEVDHRADVFSLGVTLYEALTVRRPFTGRTSQQVMNEILSADPVHPQKLNAELPTDLTAIVMMALEKEPDRRYRTAAEFAEDLRAFLVYRQVRARPPSRWRRLQRWAQREPVLATLVVVLLLAVPVGTGLLGYWAALLPTIQAGEASLRTDRLEGVLAEGFLAMEKRDYATAKRQFHAALQLEAECLEAITGLGLIASNGQHVEVFESHQATVASSRALQRLRVYLDACLRGTAEPVAEDAPLEAADGALDAFIAGITEIFRGHRGGGAAAYRRALRYLDQCVLTAEVPRPIYHYERAHALGHLSLKSQSRSAAEAIQKLWPDNEGTWFWSAFTQGKTDPEASIPAIRRAIAMAPESAKYWSNLGWYLQGSGDQVAARQAYEKSIALKRDPLVLRDYAIVLRRLGETKGAMKANDQALAAHPELLEAWIDKADMQANASQFEAMAKSVAKAVAIAPQAPKTLWVVGRLALVRGQIKPAIEALSKSLAQFPYYRTAFFLGRAKTAAGDTPGAIAAYQVAVKLSPGSAQAHTNLGNLLRSTGKPEAAERHLRLAIAAMPSLSNPNRTLWKLLNQQGRVKEMFELCRQWRRRIPEDPLAWSQTAYTTIYCGPGSRAENARAALGDARRAAELAKGKVPSVLHVLGVTEFFAGNVADSEATLQRGLDLSIRLRQSKRGVQDVIRGALRRTQEARQGK